MSRGFPTAVATALAQQNVAIVTFAKLEFPSGTVYLHNSLGSYVWDSVTAGSFVKGTTYTITSVGTTDFTLIGASANTVGETFTPTTAVAGSLVSGTTYRITAVGTTDFNAIGAPSDFEVGTIFTATGAGSGTGTVTAVGAGTGTAEINWFGVGDLGSISQVEEGLDVSPYAITLTLSGLDATISGAALTEDYYLHGVTVYLGVLDTDDVLIDTPTQIWAGFMDQMNMTVGADGGDAIQLVAESELSRFNKSLNLMYTNTAQQERSTGDLFFNFLHRIEGAKSIGDLGRQAATGLGAPVIDPDDYKNIELF
jgi:hypothetical protein